MSKTANRPTEKMSDKSFKMMSFFFKIIDTLFPHVQRRIRKFDIKQGMTIVDYGCGPGRYTIPFADKVGREGKVFAVDIHEIALDQVRVRADRRGLNNVYTIPAKGNDDGYYACDIPEKSVDMVFAIDMFFIIKRPTDFLIEVARMLRNDGVLIIDDGHQSRKETKRKIEESKVFEIVQETKDHLNCRANKAIKDSE